MEEICNFSVHAFPEYFQIKMLKTFFKIIHKKQLLHWFLMNINKMQMSENLKSQ